MRSTTRSATGRRLGHRDHHGHDQPVNDPPSAAAKTVTTNYQTATSITLTGADTETCDLAFTIVSQPAHGKLGSIGNKLCVTLLPPYSDGATVTYTPNAGYSGPDRSPIARPTAS